MIHDLSLDSARVRKACMWCLFSKNSILAKWALEVVETKFNLKRTKPTINPILALCHKTYYIYSLKLQKTSGPGLY